MTKKDWIEALLTQVVRPAKTKFLGDERQRTTLVSGNYRNLEKHERSLWEWCEIFEEFNMRFSDELQKLITKELGKGFKIQIQEYKGYLQTSSKTRVELVKVKQKNSERKYT